ncbi:MAG: long-chain-fatty-acid--CoA ligase [Chloroflexi bacterium]|nr:long-chain-fatty-acid--CoA ligase [Chloroflexota bacterium]
MNTTEFLMVTSAVAPDRDAIVFEGQRITYMDLQLRSSKLANALATLGVQKGDKVANIEVNTPNCVEAYFACAKLGATYVPLNFRAKADEIAYMLQDSDASVVLAGDRYISTVEDIKGQIPNLKHLITHADAPDGWHSFDALLDSGADEDPFTEIDDSDLTILLFTAGTTGRPKGVMLAHQNFSEYVLNNVSPVEPDVEEKNILTVPLYHIAGIQAVMAAVYGGRTIVLQRQFDPEDWMHLVQTEKVGRAMMVPTMLKQLMDHEKFKEFDLSSLKVITYGAASMPLEVIKRAIRELPGTQFINAFGQTESAATITMLSPEDHNITGTPEEQEIKLKRLGSIGKPLPDVEVKIMDEDGKRLLDVNEVGEIVARGSRIMKGYWKQDAATSTTIDAEGWLHTGDLGYVDEEGYIFLAGRAKDMIKRGGEMVSPEAVENIILELDKVEDVAVIGVPDDEWGECVRAVIVPTKKGDPPTLDEVQKVCRARLASFMKPEDIVTVDEIPRNPMGKILKRVLREQFNQPITA